MQEHLKGKPAVSDHIINCKKCRKKTASNFGSLKECRGKLETLISEAILIKHFNLFYLKSYLL